MNQILRPLLVSLLLLTLPGLSHAQLETGTNEDVDFDSPEGWAMAFMTASSLNLGQLPPRSTEFGDVSFSAELCSIPRLEREQQQVGFGGFKDEELNKSPAFGRARASLGLFWDVTAEVSWTPPLEINGAKPDGLWGFALSRPLVGGDNWGLGLRLFALEGAVNADVTCSEDTAELPPFSADNLFGCVAPSDDVLEMDHQGAELVLSFNELPLGIQPWVSIASTRMDPFVEIDALLDGGPRFSTVDSDGTTETYSAGLSYSLNQNWHLNLATSYTPLDANRPVSAGGRDSYWNVRLGLVWDL
ncbi:MAG: hypothetical protein GKR91_19665 [Pseudomonadales bacterium]|nr:hypothetical protein [Pseudomonadales bacterium]